MSESPELAADPMTARRPPRSDDSALATRIFVVEEDVRELKVQISSGFSSLHTKFDERAKIQWPALTLVLLFCSAIGALAYWPIRERQNEMREEIRYNEQRADQERTRLLEMLVKIQIDVARTGRLDGRN